MFQWLARVASAALIAGPVLSCAVAQSPDPASGQALFLRHCASCHGPLGEGDGPVAAVMPVPNLRTLSQRSAGRFPREAVTRYIDGRDLPAAHGERLMPVWGDTFADAGEDAASERIAAITAFVEQLQN